MLQRSIIFIAKKLYQKKKLQRSIIFIAKKFIVNEKSSRGATYHPAGAFGWDIISFL
jgi:hypothetical protein